MKGGLIRATRVNTMDISEFCKNIFFSKAKWFLFPLNIMSHAYNGIWFAGGHFKISSKWRSFVANSFTLSAFWNSLCYNTYNAYMQCCIFLHFHWLKSIVAEPFFWKIRNLRNGQMQSIKLESLIHSMLCFAITFCSRH